MITSIILHSQKVIQESIYVPIVQTFIPASPGRIITAGVPFTHTMVYIIIVIIDRGKDGFLYCIPDSRCNEVQPGIF